MSEQPTPAVTVNFRELLETFELANMAMAYESEVYIATETGKIHLVSTYDVIDEELPDDIGDAVKYIALPHKNELDLGSDLVFDFVDQELPQHGQAISDMFRRKGAYGRFKQFLDSRGLLERWRAFEEKATEAALRDWCAASGIGFSDG
jgi:hypothetical protein